jgi:hypothetical protein
MVAQTRNWLATEAVVDPIHIDGREYKLLLQPTKWAREPSAALANAFWTKRLRPIIQRRLDKPPSGKARFQGQFDPAKIRHVRYWDTKSHALASHELTLRQRGKASDSDGRQEITLKVRTSDLFVSAFTAVSGSRRDAKTKLEEDISPLQVQLSPAGRGRKVVADYSATRSRFSRSTTQSIGSDALPSTLAQACKLFPSLEDNLMSRHERGLTLKTRLAPGRLIEEHVFKGPKVDLGSRISGEFALTFWFFEKQRRVPQVSEISFKCDLDGGLMPLSVARRAHRLFVAMQEELADWANMQDSSKTELALPR